MHKLCYILKLNPVPDTLREFRAVSRRSSDPLCPWSTKASSSMQAVVNIHVNLVDLAHQVVHDPKEELIFFKTEKQLSEYTIKTGKYFPKEDAKDSEVLRALRRHILLPREDRGSSRRKESNKGTKDLDNDGQTTPNYYCIVRNLVYLYPQFGVLSCRTSSKSLPQSRACPRSLRYTGGSTELYNQRARGHDDGMWASCFNVTLGSRTFLW